MITKEIQIAWNGSPSKVVIKRLGYGERNQLFDEIIKEIKLAGGTPVVGGIRFSDYKNLPLIKCMVEAPFPITKEFIDKELDPDLGERIFSEIEKLNNLSTEKKSE